MVLDCFPFLGDCMFDFPPLFFSVSYNIRPQIDVKKADDNFSQLILDVIILDWMVWWTTWLGRGFPNSRLVVQVASSHLSKGK